MLRQNSWDFAQLINAWYVIRIVRFRFRSIWFGIGEFLQCFDSQFYNNRLNVATLDTELAAVMHVVQLDSDWRNRMRVSISYISLHMITKFEFFNCWFSYQLYVVWLFRICLIFVPTITNASIHHQRCCMANGIGILLCDICECVHCLRIIMMIYLSLNIE